MTSYENTEQKLTDYLTGRTDLLLKIKRVAIRHPSIVIKSGGGTESKPTNYMDDPEYSLLRIEREAIKQFLELLKLKDEDAYRIIELFYKEDKTWEEVAKGVYSSESTCRRKRKIAVEELERWLFN